MRAASRYNFFIPTSFENHFPTPGYWVLACLKGNFCKHFTISKRTVKICWVFKISFCSKLNTPSWTSEFILRVRKIEWDIELFWDCFSFQFSRIEIQVYFQYFGYSITYFWHLIFVSGYCVRFSQFVEEIAPANRKWIWLTVTYCFGVLFIFIIIFFIVPPII